MASTAAVITVSFAVVAIAQPEVAHHALDVVDHAISVVEKVVDQVCSNDAKKDTDMQYANRRGRSVNNN